MKVGSGEVFELAYQDDLVTLWYGDALDILRELDCSEPVALVCDPPYGISHASRHTGRLQGRGIMGDEDLSLRESAIEWSDGAPAIVFGSWKREPPPDTRAVLVWDKGMGVGMGDLSLPWKPNWEEIYILGDGFTGRRDDGVLKGHVMVSWASKGREHPNQKPVSLMRRLIEKIEPDRIIVDPFAGSGATLRAAKDLGRRAVGIEMDPEWIPGIKRELAQDTLLAAPVNSAEQQEALEIS